MAAMNEVMNHRNRDPKWMAQSYQSYQPAEVENQKRMDTQWIVRNQKAAAAAATQPAKASKAPQFPQTHFRVNLCCTKCEEKAREEAFEVPGVVSVIPNAQESRVTVLGAADAGAILKKFKRHVDKKATYWPADAPVPKFVVPGGGGGGGERVEKVGNGERRMGDHPRGGMKSGGDKELQGGIRAMNLDAGPGMNQQQRVVETMRADPRMVDTRMFDPMRAGPRMIDPRMVDLRERRGGNMKKVRFADEMLPVDPRQMRVGDARADMRLVNPREMMGGDVRAEMRGHAYPREMRAAEMREGWVMDPREMRGGGDMRVMRPVDPREMRGPGDMRELQPGDPRGMRLPIDAREMRTYECAPREMRHADPRTVDIREMRGDPRDYRYTGYPQESHYSARRREADLHEYQPKDFYFNDYRPSQSYPPNYSATPVSFYEEGANAYPY